MGVVPVQGVEDDDIVSAVGLLDGDRQILLLAGNRALHPCVDHEYV